MGQTNSSNIHESIKEMNDQINSKAEGNTLQENQKLPENVENKEFANNVQTILKKCDIKIQRVQVVEKEILRNIIDVMISKKVYKIRENYRKLVLKLIKMKQLSFYICYSSGRVEFQDFKNNFITQIVDGTEKYFKIRSLIEENNLSIFEISENDPNRIQLFEKNNKAKCFVNKQNSKFHTCLLVQHENEQLSVNWKLIQKIISLSMISADQEELTIIQVYAKELLDILEFIILDCEEQVKIQFKAIFKQELIEHLLSQTCKTNQQYAQLISNFQQQKFQLFERIRTYKKYVCQGQKIFLDFDSSSKLCFMSNNFEHKITASIKVLWEKDDLRIESVFHKNKLLGNLLRRAVEGKIKNNKIYQLDFETKVRIKFNEKKEIGRVQVIIEDLASQSSNSSSNIYCTSSTKILSQGSDEEQKHSQGSALMKSLQKQNPGIANEGWINLFIKQNEIKRKNTHLKNKTLITHRSHSCEREDSSDSNVSLEDNIANRLAQINMESIDLNLLELDEDLLEPFVLKLFNKVEYFKKEKIGKASFQNFLHDVHNGYQLHNNPFHNFIHGVNVMHTCYLLSTTQKCKQSLSPFRIFSIVFSGLCHDIGHTGFTNLFEIASRSKKATIYNDLSPLQNFHASFTFELLKKPENNFLSELTVEEFKDFRKQVISNILYTDIKEHFPLLKKFTALVKEETPQNEDYLTTLSAMIVHTSDFGGSAKQFEICKDWSLKVNLQFSNQYKMQGELGLPQTPFMKDLTNSAILSKNENGFLKVIVFPLYEILDDYHKNDLRVKSLRIHIENNIKMWEKINNEATQEAKTKTKQQE